MRSMKVMLGLRTGRLDLGALRDSTGTDLLAVSRHLIAELQARGLAGLEGDTLTLTRDGIMVCDELSARFVTDAHPG